MWSTKYSKEVQVTVRQINLLQQTKPQRIMTIKNGDDGLISDYECLCTYMELGGIGYINNTFTYHKIYGQCTSVPTLRAKENQMPLLSKMFLSPRHYLRGILSAIMERSLCGRLGSGHVHLSSSRIHEI